MHKQMTLWPKPESEIWPQVHPDTRKILIRTLARLIVKVLRPKSPSERKEVGHGFQ